MAELKQKLESVIIALRNDIAGLRTGRATPALVEDIEVDAYGAKQPLKSLAAISTPEPRQITIQPWDRSLIQAVEKAIQASPLGLAPIAEKDVVRLNLPTLTEERKRDLVRLLKEKLETARIAVRRVRDDAMKQVESREKAKEISEDQKFREKQDVEKAIGEANQKIEDLGRAKEIEIMAG
ncbi:ribosome recycling factor [Candidatus Parcubacteria bacterium]|nr:MAG: ribosome recycling factor [Candidatus Parcubacteria bacterium]